MTAPSAVDFFQAQREARETIQNHDRILLFGGARSGKTYLACHYVVQRAMWDRGEPTNHCIVRKDIGRARRSIVKGTLLEVFRAYGMERGKHFWLDGTDLIYTFPRSRGRIHIGGINDDESLGRILGNEYSTILLEEASEIRLDGYTQIMTRLAENKGLPRKALATCNPTIKAHWTYQVFIRRRMPDGGPIKGDLRYAYLQMNPAGNPHLPDDYIDQLHQLPPAKRRRFLEGEFSEGGENAFFGEYIYDTTARMEMMDAMAIGVDPAITATPDTSNRTGIVLVGRHGPNIYVFKDRSGIYQPYEWAQIVVELQRQTGAVIIAESNQGGELIDANIQAYAVGTYGENAYIKKEFSYHNKIGRAAGPSTLYKAKQVFHCHRKDLIDLEDELTSLTAEGYLGEGSPDRADACILAIRHLMPHIAKDGSGLWHETA